MLCRTRSQRAVEAVKAACRMLEGSLQRQQHPAQCQTARLLSWRSRILTSHGSMGLSGNPATLAFGGLHINLVLWSALEYFWCWSGEFGFALRSWRSSFGDAGEGCSGHLADI